MLLPAVAGLLVLHAAMRTERAWLFVASGFLIGVAIVMKQQALFFALLAVLFAMRSARGTNTGAVWRRGALVVAGLAAAFGLLAAVLATQGVLGRFWFWTFQYAATYVSERPVSVGISVFRAAWGHITQGTGWLWYAGIAGATCLFVVRWTRESRVFVSG